MDRTDQRLLGLLAGNGRATTIELGEGVHLSPTAVARRQKGLEEAGVIRGYAADIDPARFGLQTTVIVRITLGSQRELDLQQFEDAVAACNNVLQCFLMSGSDDYLLILLVRDLAHFEHVHKTQLSRLPHVLHIQSSFSLRQVVRRPFPVDMLD